MDPQSVISFFDTPGSGQVIHVLPQDRGAIATIRRAGDELGVRFFHLAGSRIRDRADLSDVLRQEIELPDYFGANWDALEECFKDLEWIQAQGFVILFEDPQHLWQTAREVLLTFLEIVISAAEEWAGDRTPFFLILLDGDALPGLHDCAKIRHHIEFHDSTR